MMMLMIWEILKGISLTNWKDNPHYNTRGYSISPREQILHPSCLTIFKVGIGFHEKEKSDQNRKKHQRNNPTQMFSASPHEKTKTHPHLPSNYLKKHKQFISLPSSENDPIERIQNQPQNKLN